MLNFWTFNTYFVFFWDFLLLFFRLHDPWEIWVYYCVTIEETRENQKQRKYIGFEHRLLQVLDLCGSVGLFFSGLCFQTTKIGFLVLSSSDRTLFEHSLPFLLMVFVSSYNVLLFSQLGCFSLVRICTYAVCYYDVFLLLVFDCLHFLLQLFSREYQTMKLLEECCYLSFRSIF